MSFEIRITGHAPGLHAHDTKQIAIQATRILRSWGGSASLSGGATDGVHSFTFSDADVAEAIALDEQTRANAEAPETPAEPETAPEPPAAPEAPEEPAPPAEPEAPPAEPEPDPELARDSVESVPSPS